MNPSELYKKLVNSMGRHDPAVAVRFIDRYEPIAGPGTRVFPPTYTDPGYLIEKRHRNGEDCEAVALDSVPSQANRFEEALMDAIEDGTIDLPFLSIDADIDGGHFRITSLDAPHRSPDAYFRDSVTDDGTKFDKSDLGTRLRAATAANATAFLEATPTDLVLGIWDSQRGGRGLRLPRAYTSEIVAYDPLKGVRATGRLDPYNMQSGELFYNKANKADWAFDKQDLEHPKNAVSGKPSNILHGNIPSRAEKTPGGVSVGEIERVAVISFGVLRRLRFPDSNGVVDADVDRAARAYLAAIALVGDRLAFGASSVFLRSGCDLIRQGSEMQWLSADGKSESIELNADDALELYRLAREGVTKAGFKLGGELKLLPAKNLQQLIELNLAVPAYEAD